MNIQNICLNLKYLQFKLKSCVYLHLCGPALFPRKILNCLLSAAIKVSIRFNLRQFIS